MSKFDLGAFLAPEGEDVPDSGTVREIPIAEIYNNPRNFYPLPNLDELEKLKDSIAANGLLEPPTVVQDCAEKFRLISGHSRIAALRILHSDDHASAEPTHRWDSVLCRVLPPMTPAQEECAVIEANRQRIKSPALLAQEAERLTAMYVKRREAGEELPGRIRDRVAEALNVSRTKVGNLSAIKNGIKVPGIREKWERGDIPEAAALEIARMDHETQYRLLDWMIEQHCPYTISNVKAFLKSREAAAKKAEDLPREEKAGAAPPLALAKRMAAWFPSSVEPAEGAHIVYIDDCGIADEGIYRDCLIDNGNGAAWCDVALWTLYPDLPGGAG